MKKCNLYYSKVKVKLTKAGEHVLKRRHEKTRKGLLENNGKDIGDFNLDLIIDSEGFYKTTLWIFLDIFFVNEESYDLYFENGDIIIEE